MLGQKEASSVGRSTKRAKKESAEDLRTAVGVIWTVPAVRTGKNDGRRAEVPHRDEIG
jgi:hypothetical protein